LVGHRSREGNSRTGAAAPPPHARPLKGLGSRITGLRALSPPQRKPLVSRRAISGSAPPLAKGRQRLAVRLSWHPMGAPARGRPVKVKYQRQQQTGHASALAWSRLIERHRSKQHLYSITSSARPSSERGKVTPSFFAVLTLMISSIFVACATGRSAGFSPLRIRLT